MCRPAGSCHIKCHTLMKKSPVSSCEEAGLGLGCLVSDCFLWRVNLSCQLILPLLHRHVLEFHCGVERVRSHPILLPHSICGAWCVAEALRLQSSRLIQVTHACSSPLFTATGWMGSPGSLVSMGEFAHSVLDLRLAMGLEQAAVCEAIAVRTADGMPVPGTFHTIQVCWRVGWPISCRVCARVCSDA